MFKKLQTTFYLTNVKSLLMQRNCYSISIFPNLLLDAIRSIIFGIVSNLPLNKSACDITFKFCILPLNTRLDLSFN